jgi:signal transduction histidine kinase
MTVLSAYGDCSAHYRPGPNWPLDGPSLSAEVLRTGRPARVEDYSNVQSSVAVAAREAGFDIVVGAPIIVDGRVWGVISTSSPDASLPDGLEDRLAEFTELVAMAIANGQAHAELAQLAEEQAALRRVATLVAEGASPPDVFEAVSTEVVGLVPAAEASALTRFEGDGTVTLLGDWLVGRGYTADGTRYATDGIVSGLVFASGAPARIDYETQQGTSADAAVGKGWRSSVGAPITVDGRLWGVLVVISTGEPLPPDTERRLAGFSELVATAIANAEGREELARLADEQAALRRVATLVARGAQPAEVFQAVCAEVGRLMPADAAGLSRYEPDWSVTALGGWSRHGRYDVPIGDRFVLEGPSPAWAVLETGQPSRSEGFDEIRGRGAAIARDAGWKSTVAAPIIVERQVWGVVHVASTTDSPLPEGTEARLMQFTELLAAAIANAESRAELEESRARVVATADATRRQFERNLHDGAQQQLLSLALEVRAAHANVPRELGEHRAELAHVAEGIAAVLDGLREIAMGLHPAILAEGGLGPALKTLANRSPVPVTLDLRVHGRQPESIEVAAYYVVSEALSNAIKHAHASSIHVQVEIVGPALLVTVGDDGIGGADKRRGSGLLGLQDRVAAIGGTICLESLPGKGTSLTATLPLIESSR